MRKRKRQFSLAYLLVELTLFALGFASLSVFLRYWRAGEFDATSISYAVVFLFPALGGLIRQSARGVQLAIIILVAASFAIPLFHSVATMK